MRKFIPFVLLFLIFTLGFLLSSPMILHGDFFYLSDQARDYLLTQDIIYGKHLTLIGTHSGLGGFFHGPLWLYMLVPIYLLGHGDPFTFTYFYILIALVTIFVGYVVGSRLYNRWIGLLVAFLLAIGSSVTPYVPNTIGINMVPLVYLCVFYFLVRFIRGHNTSLIFASFFVGLTLQFETAAALVLIPVSVLTVLIFRFDILKKWKIWLASVASFLISISTFILFDLKHNFLMIRSLTTITSHKEGNNFLRFPERIISHVHSLEGVITSIIYNNNPLSILLLAMIFIMGVIYIWKQKKMQKEMLVFIFIPLAMFVFFLLYPSTIYHDYVLGLTVPVALLFAVCCRVVWNERSGRVLVVLFIFVNVMFAFQSIYNSYFHYYQNQSTGSYKNQLAAVNWIFADVHNQQFGYFFYTPEVYTYTMDYLMKWKGKQIGDVPQSKKLSTTYLIMSPGLKGDKNAHEFWKKNVIHTNAPVIESKSFIGGIAVEKISPKPTEPDVDANYYQNLIFR